MRSDSPVAHGSVLEFLTKILLRSRSLLMLVVFAAIPVATRAQTDEIQVYDAEIAEPGIFNLMVHNNFTPIGRTTPAFPGAIIPNDSDNGAAEWAYGVKPWFEQGCICRCIARIRKTTERPSMASSSANSSSVPTTSGAPKGTFPVNKRVDFTRVSAWAAYG
jgi:hypothetical protein